MLRYIRMTLRLYRIGKFPSKYSLYNKQVYSTLVKVARIINEIPFGDLE